MLADRLREAAEVESEEAGEHEAHAIERVPGMGDEAFWAEGVRLGGLYVRRGETLLRIEAWTAFALAWRLFPGPTPCSAARVEHLLGRRLQRRVRRPEPNVARGCTDSDLANPPGRHPRVVGDAPELERAPRDVDGHVLRLARMERDSLEPGEGTDGHRHRRRGWGADVDLRHRVSSMAA